MLSPTEQPEKVVDDLGNLDYHKVLHFYPWIIERGQNCILSPDSDGFLCGLLMSHYLGWKVRGFYDGKVLLIDKNLSPKDCIFLDMEIFRKEVRSVGQHMVAYQYSQPPKNWDNFSQCISANNLRGFDVHRKFIEKYPFATVHLLLAILGVKHDVAPIPKSFGYLLYTDGTFKNLLNYPDNSLSWFKFLGIDILGNAAHDVFFSKKTVLLKLMIDLQNIFEALAKMNGGKRGADKIKITKMNKGNLEIVGAEYVSSKKEWRILPFIQNRNMKFLQILSSATGWEYKSTSWQYEGFCLKEFTKGSTVPTKGRYLELMAQNPVSFAITSKTKTGIEYTLEGPDKLL